jgi:hypothetical protein
VYLHLFSTSALGGGVRGQMRSVRFREEKIVLLPPGVEPTIPCMSREDHMKHTDTACRQNAVFVMVMQLVCVH